MSIKQTKMINVVYAKHPIISNKSRVSLKCPYEDCLDGKALGLSREEMRINPSLRGYRSICLSILLSTKKKKKSILEVIIT